MQHRQSPIVAIVGDTDRSDHDAQERRAWGLIAEACDDALMQLDPYHPQRGEFVAMRTECRQAAGLPPAPAVRRTA